MIADQTAAARRGSPVSRISRRRGNPMCPMQSNRIDSRRYVPISRLARISQAVQLSQPGPINRRRRT
jgi:hypothetical protein